MKVIFLTMAPIADISIREIYTDLLNYFVVQGHQIYLVSPRDRRMGIKTYMKEDGAVNYLGVRTLNLQKTNVIEKGIGQVMVSGLFKRAIKKYWGNESFNLILYSTPPITLQGVVKWLKSQNPQALSYLLLKDIFPQNAIDIDMMTKNGVKGILYRHFRNQEKKLYVISDYIGCMSPANVEYVLKHNPEVPPEKVEVAPNSVVLQTDSLEEDQHKPLASYVRSKYNLPIDSIIFIYGGNLGKPQGIPFLIECLKANKNRKDCFFLIVGNGTEQLKLTEWYEEDSPDNVKMMKRLSKNDYDELIRACDVGMIFLDHRFTIPNYPSRALSYMENRMPILCATDPNCDMGPIAEENGFGYWCESNSVEAFTAILDKMINSDRKAMGVRGYQYLKDNYLVEHTYHAIMKHISKV